MPHAPLCENSRHELFDVNESAPTSRRYYLCLETEAVLRGQYNIALVVLSYCVAVIASHVTLELAGRLRDPLKRAPMFWLIGGALSMGTGIWSMHFIGMLAFDLPITVLYDLGLTTLSWAIAVAVSGFALHIVRRGVTGANGLVDRKS